MGRGTGGAARRLVALGGSAADGVGCGRDGGVGRVGTFLPLFAVLLVEASLTRWLKKRMQAIFASTENTFESLDLLSGMLARLEQEEFHAPRLQALQTSLTTHAMKGSEAIARLRTVVDLIDSRRQLVCGDFRRAADVSPCRWR